MKKILILTFAALSSIGCSGAAQQSNTASANANQAIVKSNDSAIVSSHSTDSEKVSSSPNKTSSTESPMARPIDVAELTAAIERGETDFRKNPKTKEALAKAYFTRAFALTETAQYRAALGDFRRGLKLNPADEDAKKMHDKILEIFKSINREPPKDGEEPNPLPFKKEG